MTRFALEDLSPEHRKQARAQLSDAANLIVHPPGLVSVGPAVVEAVAAVSREAKPRKYRNEPVIADGERFDSKWELQRWTELKMQQAAMQISNLRRQIPFSLDVWTPKGPVRIGAYIADFVYERVTCLVVEDAKSEATRNDRAYQLKRRHFEAQYGIAITEVMRAKRKRKP